MTWSDSLSLCFSFQLQWLARHISKLNRSLFFVCACCWMLQRRYAADRSGKVNSSLQKTKLRSKRHDESECRHRQSLLMNDETLFMTLNWKIFCESKELAGREIFQFPISLWFPFGRDRWPQQPVGRTNQSTSGEAKKRGWKWKINEKPLALMESLCRDETLSISITETRAQLKLFQLNFPATYTKPNLPFWLTIFRWLFAQWTHECLDVIEINRKTFRGASRMYVAITAEGETKLRIEDFAMSGQCRWGRVKRLSQWLAI